jgi:hypothetical protein
MSVYPWRIDGPDQSLVGAVDIANCWQRSLQGG